MSIETRLRRIEAAAKNQTEPADQALLDHYLAIIEIVYSTDDEAEQQAKLEALGPRPPATTPAAIQFERNLMMAYGDPW